MEEEKQKKNNAGRPTLYDPIYCQKVDEYLETVIDDYKVKDIKVIDNTGDEKIMQKKVWEVTLPTIGDFALFIDTPERTIYDWKDAHQEFSQSLSKIVKLQEKKLLNNGLSGKYNSTIAKLVLSANHGYKERNDVTSDDEKIDGIQVEFINGRKQEDKNED